MTNREKFKEVFGFEPCCLTMCKDCPHECGDEEGEAFCNEVVFWNSDYKEGEA